LQLFLHKSDTAKDIEENQTLIIIGSGPAGLTAAIYAARAQLNPLVIAGISPGGQLMTTTEVENFPGFPDMIQGPDLIAEMRLQAKKLGTLFLEENVVDLNLNQSPFMVLTNQRQFFAKAIIIATGAEPKRLGLKSELRLSGRGLSYCATCDAPFFKDVEAAVIGGGDTAFEEALFLAKYANHVLIIYRRTKEKIRAIKTLQERVFSNENIEVKCNTIVKEIVGEEKLEGIIVEDLGKRLEYEIPLGGLLISIGHVPQTEIFKGKVELIDGYIKHVKYTMTSKPGVFAAGDVVDFRYRQAITAAAQGCQAAIDAERWLQDPNSFD